MVHTQYVALDAGRFGCNTDTYNYLLLSGNSLSFVFYFILFFHVHRHPDKIPILQGLGERLFAPRQDGKTPTNFSPLNFNH